jgi:predicted nucleotide-binding protein
MSDVVRARTLSALVIEDDRTTNNLFEADLASLGFSVNGVCTIKAGADALRYTSFDLCVIDMYVPYGGKTPSGLSSLSFAASLKKQQPQCKIIGCSQVGLFDEAEVRKLAVFDAWFRKFGQPRALAKAVARALGWPQRLQSFIVHGHDKPALLELKNFIQNSLKLCEPVVLAERPSGGATIIEKLEKYGDDIDVVFVLATPDDVGRRKGTPVSRSRARQNVIFELGYFFGKVHRRSGRVVVLHKGDLDLPSDINGVIYIDIAHGIQAAGDEIRRELDGIMWSSQSDRFGF